MADEPDTLVHQSLRNIDAKVGRLTDNMHGVTIRLTAVDEGSARAQTRIDRLECGMERTERRLDLVDVAPLSL